MHYCRNFYEMSLKDSHMDRMAVLTLKHNLIRVFKLYVKI